MNQDQLEELLQRYQQDACTPSEKALVEMWYQQLYEQYDWDFGPDKAAIGQQLKHKLMLHPDISAGLPEQGNIAIKPLRHLLRRSWLRYAAILLFVLLTGAYFIFHFTYDHNKPVINVSTINKLPDIQPGGNKAVLTLADGSRIVLGDGVHGDLAQEGHTKIIQLDSGTLAYKTPVNEGQSLYYYNTISTPPGGQYRVVLPDGSRVWLNASSSIRFPTPFPFDNRTVSVTGEAYFEVVKNKKAPFVVQVNQGIRAEVLGTSFNINVYPDEPMQQATVVAGSIKISGARASVFAVLGAGQQALSRGATSGIFIINEHADTTAVMAWKNGYFSFNKADVVAVLRQLGRWYDLDIVFEGSIPTMTFTGEMDRGLKLRQVLRMLAKTGVQFRQEERKLIVTGSQK